MADGDGRGVNAVSTTSSASTKPARAQTMLLISVALLTVVLLVVLGRDTTERPSRTEAARGGDFSLTDQEAIERFKALNELATRAGATRDVSLLSSVFTPDGEIGERAIASLRRLARDGVRDKTRVRIIDIDVVSNSASEIRIVETSILKPCFVTDKGIDVTEAPDAIRQRGEWTLRRVGDQWLIHDGVLKTENVINGRSGSC